MTPAATPATRPPAHCWYRTNAQGETVRLAIYLPMFLRKNERYRAFGKGRFARIILSSPARKFEAAVAHVIAVIGAPPITSGVWKLTVHTVWDKQRHVGPSVPHGDSDASLSAIKDALQNGGAIDDDVRIITDETFNYYRKGERGLYAVLERLDMAEPPTLLPPDMLAAMAAAATLPPPKPKSRVVKAARKPKAAPKPAKATKARVTRSTTGARRHGLHPPTPSPGTAA